MDKVVGGVGMQLVTEMEIVPYYDLVICGVMSDIFSANGFLKKLDSLSKPEL